MTLPLLPTRAGRHSGRRLAGAALFLLLALAAALPAARADDADPFTATVAVDATADSVVKAREAARTDGQRRALAAVVARLSNGNDGAAAKLAKLNDQAITDLVLSFGVANEHMSAVRYLADYTFRFRPDEVKRLLGAAGVATGDQSGKPVVVLPVLQAGGQLRLWDDPNPWRESWDRLPAASGAVRLVVPLGDVGDMAAIDADKAGAGDAAALAAIARRNGTDEAVVALAAPRGPADAPAGVDVTLRRYRAGQLVDSRTVPLAANPGENADALLRRAAAAAVADLESGWKKTPVAGYDQQGSLTAVLPITGLDDWVEARKRIAGIAAIRKIALVALSRQEATIEIDYVGTIDQLKASLAGISLGLVQDDKSWRLARSGAAAAP